MMKEKKKKKVREIWIERQIENARQMLGIVRRLNRVNTSYIIYIMSQKPGLFLYSSHTLRIGQDLLVINMFYFHA